MTVYFLFSLQQMTQQARYGSSRSRSRMGSRHKRRSWAEGKSQLSPWHQSDGVGVLTSSQFTSMCVVALFCPLLAHSWLTAWSQSRWTMNTHDVFPSLSHNLQHTNSTNDCCGPTRRPIILGFGFLSVPGDWAHSSCWAPQWRSWGGAWGAALLLAWLCLLSDITAGDRRSGWGLFARRGSEKHVSRERRRLWLGLYWGFMCDSEDLPTSRSDPDIPH